MSIDSFTEVSSQGWFSRIGGSIKGIVVGLVLCLVGPGLLWWNEGRAVERHKSLQEVGSKAVTVETGSVLPENEGKVVHMTGEVTVEGALKDGKFGVEAPAVKLRRTAEMYQWKESSKSETKKKLGGGEETTTTYSYSKGWEESLISSSNFKKPEGHVNPSSKSVASKIWMAKPVQLGAFTLSDSQVSSLNAWEGLAVAGEEVAGGVAEARVVNGGYYIGKNPGSPAIGDVRISFEQVLPGMVSLVSQQKGDSFVPFKAKAGGDVALLQMGEHSMEEMVAKAESDNKMLAWILRLVGFVVLFVAFSMIFRPFRVVADVLPFAGTLVGMGLGLVSFVLAAVVSLVVIAVAWIFYRPLLGILLLAVVVGLIVWLLKKRSGAKSALA